jgi:hypothetical protein
MKRIALYSSTFLVFCCLVLLVISAHAATFGTLTQGDNYLDIYESDALVAGAVLSETGTTSKISVYMETGSGTCPVKGVIYDNDGAGGSPGTVLAVGSAVTVDTDLEWYDSTLSVELSAGTYWIGVIAGSGSTVLVQVFNLAGTYNAIDNDNLYSSPTSFVVTSSNADWNVSAYVTYTAAGGTPTSQVIICTEE